jgi:hypothetical protein
VARGGGSMVAQARCNDSACGGDLGGGRTRKERGSIESDHTHCDPQARMYPHKAQRREGHPKVDGMVGSGRAEPAAVVGAMVHAYR